MAAHGSDSIRIISPNAPLRSSDKSRLCSGCEKTRAAYRLIVPEVLAEVFLGAIAEDSADRARFAAGHQVTRDQSCSVHIAPGRNPHQKSLFPGQAADHLVGVLGLDPQDAVAELFIVEPGTNRGRHVFQAFEAVETARRLCGPALGLGE